MTVIYSTHTQERMFALPGVLNLNYGDRIIFGGRVYRISGRRLIINDNSAELVHGGYFARDMGKEKA